MGPDSDDVIEVKLPAGWPAPMSYALNATDKPEDAEGPHVYLSGSVSRLAGTEISVIDGDGNASDAVGADGSQGWFVRVVLGTKGASKNSTIVLKYSDVTVQRGVAEGDDVVLIEAFSGVSIGVGYLPQFPVTKPEEDKITVKQAANGSGVLTFEFGGNLVLPLTGEIKRHTDVSIPAGIIADDALDLILVYTPDGDMGAGEFEVRLPSGWDAAEIQASHDGMEQSGRVVTVPLPDHFGEASAEKLEITLVDVTVPNVHGNRPFLAKSKNAGGTLAQLSPRSQAFVGNARAAGDTVKVDIDPEVAYQNEDNVDFEITLTAKGPMHDSNIQITVPDGLVGLQTETAADPNYVKRVSASVSGVVVSIDGVDNEIIHITTGRLNADGKIKVRLENVDLDSDVSANEDTGFRVATRTRGFDPDADDGYLSIEEADGARSIMGGLIRTVAGSGVLVVEPATIEQGSRNRTFDTHSYRNDGSPRCGHGLSNSSAVYN